MTVPVPDKPSLVRYPRLHHKLRIRANVSALWVRRVHQFSLAGIVVHGSGVASSRSFHTRGHARRVATQRPPRRLSFRRRHGGPTRCDDLWSCRAGFRSFANIVVEKHEVLPWQHPGLADRYLRPDESLRTAMGCSSRADRRPDGFRRMDAAPPRPPTPKNRALPRLCLRPAHERG